jgi:hypothetical protein
MSMNAVLDGFSMSQTRNSGTLKVNMILSVVYIRDSWQDMVKRARPPLFCLTPLQNPSPPIAIACIRLPYLIEQLLIAQIHSCLINHSISHIGSSSPTSSPHPFCIPDNL